MARGARCSPVMPSRMRGSRSTGAAGGSARWMARSDQNEKIGSVDGLIVTRDNKVAMAVISVGGFLGIGNKLVAVPFDQLRLETTKENEQRMHLAGGSKEALNAMPNFTYGNG